mmetsp:Transcript_10916/g.23336  ORF Transcript_10916/g.23336 Transcript_10916/m.23336 type:complete len:258 (-) Transcript_10916:9-782(-)
MGTLPGCSRRWKGRRSACTPGARRESEQPRSSPAAPPPPPPPRGWCTVCRSSPSPALSHSSRTARPPLCGGGLWTAATPAAYHSTPPDPPARARGPPPGPWGSLTGRLASHSSPSHSRYCSRKGSGRTRRLRAWRRCCSAPQSQTHPRRSSPPACGPCSYGSAKICSYTARRRPARGTGGAWPARRTSAESGLPQSQTEPGHYGTGTHPPRRGSRPSLGASHLATPTSGRLTAFEGHWAQRSWQATQDGKTGLAETT